MKHQKEWRTCDSCGAEIKKGILCENSITKNGILNTTYDLCYKCMEDFEGFMRNKNINTRNSAKAVDEALDNATINNVPFREWIDNVNNAYENKKCNLTSCRYNADGKCTNEEKREECVEVSGKVLCIDEENKK